MEKGDIISWPDFNSNIKNGLNGTYILYGDDDYIKNSIFRSIYKNVIKDNGFEDMNYIKVSFSLDPEPFEKLDDALSTIPMMQDQVLIEVKEFDFEKSPKTAFEQIAKLCSYSDNQNIIVFITKKEELDVDRNFTQSSIYKTLGQYCVFVNCSHLERGKFASWASKLALKEKCVLSQNAQYLLYDMTNGDMQTAENELAKLISYALSQGETYIISENDVKNICTSQIKEEEDFELSNAANTWSLKEMINCLSRCKDRQEEPIAVLSRLEVIYNEMLDIKAALVSGLTPQKAAEKLNMNAYKASLIASNVNKPPLSLIETAVKEAFICDVKMKSTSLDGWLLLDELLVKIYTPKNLR